jgi:hypothetical protein
MQPKLDEEKKQNKDVLQWLFFDFETRQDMPFQDDPKTFKQHCKCCDVGTRVRELLPRSERPVLQLLRIQVQ